MEDLFSNVQYDLVNSPKGTVSLEIDLEKSRPGLVPKKVVIHQENGKTHMGIRWVKPGEDGSNSNSSSPQESEPVKGNVLYPDSESDNSDNAGSENSRVDMSQVSPQELEEEPQKDYSYLDKYLPDEDEEYEDPWANFSVDDLPGREVDMFFEQSSNTESLSQDMKQRYDSAIELSGISGLHDFGGYLNDFKESVMNSDDFHNPNMAMSDCLKLFDSVISRHPKTFKERSHQHIESFGTDRFVKAVQKGIVNDRVFNSNDSFGRMCMIPEVLKHSLIYTMGEELYTEARNQLYNSNLTINTDSSHIDKIMKSGYVASNLEDYISSQSSEPDSDLQLLEEICSNLDDDQYDIIDSLGSEYGGIWHSIGERAMAEYLGMGLELEDRKPCYIAYNPDGDNSVGGAPEYGDGSVLEVSSDLLSQCTVMPTDSFMRSGCCPVVCSEDHLKDIFIYRALQQSSHTYSGDYGDARDRDRNFIKSKSWLTQMKHGGEIPLEIQYHHSVIQPEHLKVVNRA